jgi:hypothetical protein
MSELPPEAAVRNRALSPAPAPAAWGCTQRPRQGTGLPRSRPFPAQASHTPGVNPRPADAACICTSHSRQNHKPNNQIKFFKVKAPFPISHALCTLSLSDDHIRRRHAEGTHQKQSGIRRQPHPGRSVDKGLQGQANVESAPDSGHLVAAHISARSTAGDPRSPCSSWPKS